jgi:hypothetical protein
VSHGTYRSVSGTGFLSAPTWATETPSRRPRPWIFVTVVERKSGML